MGLFDSYATPVDQIPTGFGLEPSNTPYAVYLTDVKFVTPKNSDTASTVLTFTISKDHDELHRSGKEDVWIKKPVDGEDNADVYARIAKQWVLNLGIPASVYTKEGFEIPDVKDKVLGTQGYMKVTAGDKPGYTNKSFRRVQVKDETPAETVIKEPVEEVVLDLGGNW